MQIINELSTMTASEIVEEYQEEIKKQSNEDNFEFIIYKKIMNHRNFEYNFRISIFVHKENEKYIPSDKYVKLEVDCIDLELEQTLHFFYDTYNFMHHYSYGCSEEVYDDLIYLAEKDINMFFYETLNHYNNRIEKLKEEKKYIESKIEELNNV